MTKTQAGMFKILTTHFYNFLWPEIGGLDEMKYKIQLWSNNGHSQRRRERDTQRAGSLRHWVPDPQGRPQEVVIGYDRYTFLAKTLFPIY